MGSCVRGGHRNLSPEVKARWNTLGCKQYCFFIFTLQMSYARTITLSE